MTELTIIQKVCIWILPILFAITLHEAAHAFVANYLGDSTAKMLGRLSLNPIRHIDLIGTIILPIMIAVLTQFNFIFGYAKPVPINYNQLKKPRRDMALVAFAGPLANFIMAFMWAGLFKIVTLIGSQASMPVLFLLITSQAGILINLVLAFLNLIPIAPLDGSKIVVAFLPPRAAMGYLAIEPYGFFILLLLLLTGLLGIVLNPLINIGYSVIGFVFNI